METRDRLPVFPVPPTVAEQVAQPTLQVDGLVAEPRVLTPADLAALPRTGLAEPFTCEEGWSVPGLRWQGVRLSAVLALAVPLPNARYVRVRSGEYAIPIPLDQAGDALLADWLNGEPLRLEHGAPWRLALSGAQCFMSVKWVTHLELTAEPGSSTGEQIARARLR